MEQLQARIQQLIVVTKPSTASGKVSIPLIKFKK